MFIRLVKMTFESDRIEEFLDIFDSSKDAIRAYGGCNQLELYRDKTDPNVFFTYSIWDSEQHLDQYRNSELFNRVWGKTKLLFSSTPQAWSVDKIVSLP
ncbi:MAG: antibiotic biosynthesis monooxygenase [Flavobacteriaceae bacterium]|nr:antibiotic biosynthesis monooxygenase [Flavobacteriaceae bacterium]